MVGMCWVTMTMMTLPTMMTKMKITHHSVAISVHFLKIVAIQECIHLEKQKHDKNLKKLVDCLADPKLCLLSSTHQIKN